jgi:16S rRNA processing protein RimM
MQLADKKAKTAKKAAPKMAKTAAPRREPAPAPAPVKKAKATPALKPEKPASAKVEVKPETKKPAAASKAAVKPAAPVKPAPAPKPGAAAAKPAALKPEAKRPELAKAPKASPPPAAVKKTAKPEPKAAAKVEAKAKAVPKAVEPKTAKAVKPGPEPKLAKAGKAAPEKTAKAEPASKPAAKSAPVKVAAVRAEPKPLPVTPRPPSRPPVTSGGSVSVLRPPAPLRNPPAPKVLSTPKPVVVAPETVGESQAVPAFKGKTNGDKKGLVLVGAIAGAFGVKGEVRLRAFTTKKDGVISYGPLYSADGRVLLKPKSWRELRDGVAVVAPEIASKEDADKMRGVRLYVPRANLPAPAEDEFYIVDLLGCKAEALDGTVMGDIIAVWNFGAGDILEYRPPNGGPNQRITFTKESVPHVDLAGKRVVLDPPPPEPPAK